MAFLISLSFLFLVSSLHPTTLSAKTVGKATLTSNTVFIARG